MWEDLEQEVSTKNWSVRLGRIEIYGFYRREVFQQTMEKEKASLNFSCFLVELYMWWQSINHENKRDIRLVYSFQMYEGRKWMKEERDKFEVTQ